MIFDNIIFITIMNYENNINEITENLIPDNNNNEIQLMPLESDKPSSIFLSKTFKISVIILLISVLFTSNNYLTIENIFFFSPAGKIREIPGERYGVFDKIVPEKYCIEDHLFPKYFY